MPGGNSPFLRSSASKLLGEISGKDSAIERKVKVASDQLGTAMRIITFGQHACLTTQIDDMARRKQIDCTIATRRKGVAQGVEALPFATRHPPLAFALVDDDFECLFGVKCGCQIIPERKVQQLSAAIDFALYGQVRFLHGGANIRVACGWGGSFASPGW